MRLGNGAGRGTSPYVWQTPAYGEFHFGGTPRGTKRGAKVLALWNTAATGEDK